MVGGGERAGAEVSILVCVSVHLCDRSHDKCLEADLLGQSWDIPVKGAAAYRA